MSRNGKKNSLPITIDRAKVLLGEHGKNMTDAEIEGIIRRVETAAEIIINVIDDSATKKLNGVSG
ncbi:MAG: hypothetical protein EOO17_01225 [Chloroflexi bacterium]|nr:MAG: hypothetical protein EOO17_01225 [Chloroflexota bacterium]